MNSTATLLINTAVADVYYDYNHVAISQKTYFNVNVSVFMPWPLVVDNRKPRASVEREDQKKLEIWRLEKEPFSNLSDKVLCAFLLSPKLLIIGIVFCRKKCSARG